MLLNYEDSKIPFILSVIFKQIIMKIIMNTGKFNFQGQLAQDHDIRTRMY